MHLNEPTLSPNRRNRTREYLDHQVCEQARRLCCKEFKKYLKKVGLKKNTEKLSLRNRRGQTLLHVVADRQDSEALPLATYLVCDLELNLVDVPDSFGWTPLHTSCSSGNLALVDFLLHNDKRRSDMSLSTVDGCQPIHYIVLHTPKIYHYLPYSNDPKTPTSPKKKSGSPRRKAHTSCQLPTRSPDDSPRGITNTNRSGTISFESLRKKVLSYDNIFESPVYSVFCDFFPLIAELLGEEREFVNSENFNGETPLHRVATKGKSVEIAQFLVDNGAEINKRNKYGDTELHCAVRCQRSDMVEFLLSIGGDPTIVGKAGTARRLSRSTPVEHLFVKQEEKQKKAAERKKKQKVENESQHKQHTIPNNNGHTKPETFALSDGKNLVWKDDGGLPVISEGTLDDLIDCSILGTSGPDYLDNFLISHTYFVESSKLLTMLKERFNSFDSTQKILKLRIVNVMKTWIKSHGYYLTDDKQLYKNFEQFIGEMKKEGGEKEEWAEILKTAMQSIGEHEPPTYCGLEDPIPLVPITKLGEELRFLHMHPLEVARQLTLIEHGLFRSITPMEFHHCNWIKKKAPNIDRISDHFNRVTQWIKTEIIQTEDHKQRECVLSNLIEMAVFLRSMNNLQGVMEVYVSLHTGPVQRLKSSWKSLPAKYTQYLAEIEKILQPSNNYINYRKRLEVLRPPMIPLSVVVLGDLSFIEEVPTMVEDKTDVINFDKMRLFAKNIKRTQLLQKCVYPFTVVPSIEEYLKHPPLLDENELYARAKALEASSSVKKKWKEKSGPSASARVDYRGEGSKTLKEFEKQEVLLRKKIARANIVVHQKK